MNTNTELTVDLLKKKFSYDPETGNFFYREVTNKHKAKEGQLAGQLNAGGYLRVYIETKSYRLHRLAWLYMTGTNPPEGMDVDHKNRIRTDNRWVNLRLASHSQTSQNSSKQRGRNSVIKGVRLIPAKGTTRPFYMARVALEGKTYSFSRSFDGLSPESAQLALDSVSEWLTEKRLELHGEFAND